MLCEECGFHLAQDFYWWNPSKLPTPAEWVTIRRIRVKDAINTIWWLSKSPFPKATNKRVLVPYSKHQLDLMSNGYKAKKRPSGHDISKSFQRDNRGSIPSNLIALPNTGSKDKYFKYCESRDIKPHPARFPVDIPAIFIRMLTEKGDTVFDPFAGSCTTGAAAEIFERSWVCCDTEKQYLEGAKGRFTKEALTAEKERILFGNGKRPRRPFYEAPAPCLNLIGEEDSPLPQDGGKHK
jgi:site-specific DNA-methyltransferase (cytosine-N4-specific)